MIRYLLATLAVSLATAGPAFGDPLPTGEPQYTRKATESLRIAREFWGVDLPCATVYAMPYEQMRRFGIGTMGLNEGCGIFIASWLMENRTYEWRVKACDTIVHEYGHALGYNHTADLRSVMSVSRPEHAVVYGCYTRFVPKAKRREWRDMLGRPPRWLSR